MRSAQKMFLYSRISGAAVDTNACVEWPLERRVAFAWPAERALIHEMRGRACMERTLNTRSWTIGKAARKLIAARVRPGLDMLTGPRVPLKGTDGALGGSNALKRSRVDLPST